MKYCFSPIGYVRTNKTDEEVRSSISGVDGEIEILEEYSRGLAGIEEFSHVIVVSCLHKSKWDGNLIRKPLGLVKFGVRQRDLPEVGVFSTNSPIRPNPIAVSVLELYSIKRRRFLEVGGLDLFDGTPVLDLKPYTPGKRIESPKYPNWLSIVLGKRRNEIVRDEETLRT